MSALGRLKPLTARRPGPVSLSNSRHTWRSLFPSTTLSRGTFRGSLRTPDQERTTPKRSQTYGHQPMRFGGPSEKDAGSFNCRSILAELASGGGNTQPKHRRQESHLERLGLREKVSINEFDGGALFSWALHGQVEQHLSPRVGGVFEHHPPRMMAVDSDLLTPADPLETAQRERTQPRPKQRGKVWETI